MTVNINVTIPDDAHRLLELLKKWKSWSNDSEAFEGLIRDVYEKTARKA
jgi:hypothetical protein